MRVVVLGSGVVGVTSAYYLARAGHDVTVVDRAAGPALETSFANAGQISPGYASPWAAPGVPLKAVKWMFQKHAPLAIRLDGTQFQLQWMWQMLRNCTSERYAVNKARMVRLAEYSRDCLQALRTETGIQYEGRTGGTLQLFRTQQQLDGAAKDVDAECARFERAIRAAGGIDLLVLGIGANGHIGFNEPGAALFARTHRARLTAATRRANAGLFAGRPAMVPREALSMGMGTILAARAIVLIATGRPKARAIKAMLSGRITPSNPASFLQLHHDVTLVLDRAAARQA